MTLMMRSFVLVLVHPELSCSQYKKFGSITLGILSWGNLIDPNSYIDYTVVLLLVAVQ